MDDLLTRAEWWAQRCSPRLGRNQGSLRQSTKCASVNNATPTCGKDASAPARQLTLLPGSPVFSPGVPWKPAAGVAAAAAAPAASLSDAGAKTGRAKRRRGALARRNRSARRSLDPAILSRGDAFYVGAIRGAAVGAGAATAPRGCPIGATRPSLQRNSRDVPGPPLPPRATSQEGGSGAEFAMQFVERLLESCTFLRSLLLKTEYLRATRAPPKRKVNKTRRK
jgi:hypothetical protein